MKFKQKSRAIKIIRINMLAFTYELSNIIYKAEWCRFMKENKYLMALVEIL